eukprot:2932153-Amphidinium_carterae.1
MGGVRGRRSLEQAQAMSQQLGLSDVCMALVKRSVYSLYCLLRPCCSSARAYTFCSSSLAALLWQVEPK